MVHMFKVIIYPGIFFHFSKFWFLGGQGDERAKNGPKWQKILSVSLHISETVHYMIVIFGTQMCKIMISPGFFFIFLKKCNIVNIKIILFFICSLQHIFNRYLFFKFISKCQKEILRCAPPSSHMCDFFELSWTFLSVWIFCEFWWVWSMLVLAVWFICFNFCF